MRELQPSQEWNVSKLPDFLAVRGSVARATMKLGWMGGMTFDCSWPVVRLGKSNSRELGTVNHCRFIWGGCRVCLGVTGNMQ